METNDRKFGAGTADITPRPLDCGIPTLGELIGDLFAGFAPIARGINADAKERGDGSC